MRKTNKIFTKTFLLFIAAISIFALSNLSSKETNLNNENYIVDSNEATTIASFEVISSTTTSVEIGYVFNEGDDWAGVPTSLTYEVYLEDEIPGTDTPVISETDITSTIDPELEVQTFEITGLTVDTSYDLYFTLLGTELDPYNFSTISEAQLISETDSTDPVRTENTMTLYYTLAEDVTTMSYSIYYQSVTPMVEDVEVTDSDLLTAGDHTINISVEGYEYGDYEMIVTIDGVEQEDPLRFDVMPLEVNNTALGTILIWIIGIVGLVVLFSGIGVFIYFLFDRHKHI